MGATTGSAAVKHKAKAKPAAEAGADYARDQITVTASGREQTMPTANCLVWANAEGFGVGPDQLGGLHGLQMNINEHPLAAEEPHPQTFAVGMANVKAAVPTAPAWLMATLQKNQAAIETACAVEHMEPFKVYTITKADMKG